MVSRLPRVVGVVGAGQMGSGIAQLMATHGMQVILFDKSTQDLESGRSAIVSSLQRLAKKGSISFETVDDTLARISATAAVEDLQPSEFVIEAVVEKEEVKKTIFRSLDKVTRPDTILATNTSSLSITRLATATSRPDKVVGMHFMNPPPIMQLVELIRGLATSNETFERTRALAQHLGKTCSQSQDRPGFIVNRILMPMINEAFFALMEGVSSAEDIDAGMKLGTNVPMGPLTLADFIGLDTCLSIMSVLHRGLGEDKYRPCPLLVQYVDAGWLGRKSGQGVYSYKR